MLKKILIMLVLVMLLSTPVSAEIIVHAGTEITDELEIVDVEKNTYNYGEEVYVIAYSDEPFDQKYLELTVIDTSGLGEQILLRTDMEIDPNWQMAGMPFTPDPGEYRVMYSTYNESGSVSFSIVE